MSSVMLMCEPEQASFGHAPLNAALLKTLAVAYPDMQTIFYAAPAHHEAVRGQLATGNEPAPFEAESIVAPARNHGVASLMREEFAWCRRVLGRLREPDARFLLLSSLTDSGLLALKMCMVTMGIRKPVIAIPHGNLSTLGVHQSSRPWRRLVNLPLVMGLPHPRILRFIALGPSILEGIEGLRPQLARRFRAVDHPYEWQRDFASVPTAPVRFGYFGVSSRNKGLGAYLDVARTTHTAHAGCEFHLVGFVRDSPDTSEYEADLVGVGTEPLSREEFGTRADGITYGVWTGNPDHYRLTASATFLDTLSYVRPGIFLRNPYVEHYFDRMGDIGYLCDDLAALKRTVLDVIEDFPTERYAEQCRNILAGRSIFEPGTQAAIFRGVVEEIESA